MSRCLPFLESNKQTPHNFRNDCGPSFCSLRHTDMSVKMDSCQPHIDRVHIEAAWSGDLSNAVNLKILVDIAAKGKSHLALIRKSHPSVLFAQATAISKLPRMEQDVSPFAPSSRHRPPEQETIDSLTALPKLPMSGNEQHGNTRLAQGEPTSIFISSETCRNADMRQQKEKTHLVSYDQPDFSAETVELPLFAQSASLYEATSSRDSAVSPPPPPTSKKLTVPKRLSIEPKAFRTPQQQSPQKQRLARQDNGSPQSIRKRPVSLDKRPPWRPVGADDTTQRGRKPFGTDGAKRRISRSTGAVQVTRGRARHRQSSLPGQVPRTERDLHILQGAERQTGTQTLPRARLLRSPVCTGPRDRDSTVKVTRYAEALNASERLETWLEDRRSNWPAEDSSASEFISDDHRSLRLANSPAFSNPALSPSPTPSSRAALPWAISAGIRGGGSLDGAYCEVGDGIPTPTLIEDNGTLFAFFHSCSADESKTVRVCIEIYASIKLEPQTLGCHSLAVPGLPLQSGNTEGTFTLRVTRSAFSGNDEFKPHEKVALLDDNFSTQPMQRHEVSQNFPLDTPFNVKFLCFETCRALAPSDFEIDSDVHTQYEWENLDGDGIVAEHSMVCSLRLHPFLMWAENVTFKLYLIGGPSGTLETTLEPGSRRIYLNGERCDTEHELEISFVCPVADLQKTFTISWVQSLGIPPFEVWLPRISGLYREKLEDIFDLPHEAGVSIAPRPCKKSRVYSMVAQEEFLKSSGQIFFFPENQHTPRTIRQSLTEHSGQFYDELAPEDLVSGSNTPASEDSTMPVKHITVSLKPTKRPRTGRPELLRSIVTDLGHHSTGRVGLKESAEKTTPDAAIAKSIEVVSVETTPHRPKSYLLQGVLFLLRVLSWLSRGRAGPAGLFKNMVLIWLCFRAFNHDGVVQIEHSIKSKALNAWNRWEFEPVQLHDDFTGWKHLMAKINQATARVVLDGHLGVLSRVDRQSEGVEEDAEEIFVMIEEIPVEETSSVEEPVLMQESFDGGSSSPLEEEDTKEEPLTLLDRIDRALGWNPPAGL